MEFKEALNKCEIIIQGCKTKEHLKTAQKYLKMFINKYGKCTDSNFLTNLLNNQEKKLFK